MRIARHVQVGVVHHIISRFVDRSWQFQDAHERATYLERLGRAVTRSDWRCLAYALMSNHVHLAMIAGHDEVGALLKRVHSPFANWMNARRERLGPVFADRPAIWSVGPGSEARLIAYIHTNPVRAEVVERASESPWTSHRAYTGRAPAPSWLDAGDGLRRCGVSSREFDAWVASVAGEIDRPRLNGLRRAAHRFGALELATPSGSPVTVPLVARPFAHVRPAPPAIIDAVSEELAVAASRFRSRSRRPELVHARRVVLAVSVQLGVTIADASAALGITRQAGSRLASHTLDEAARATVLVIAKRLER